jgi:hypothetical protein
MQTFLLPLNNEPQVFQISLAGKEYLLTSKWNDSPDAGWVLDFADAITNESIVSNIPLITGVNVLAGLDYLGFNGSLIVFTDGDDFAVPTLTNLGQESNVYFVTEAADV